MSCSELGSSSSLSSVPVWLLTLQTVVFYCLGVWQSNVATSSSVRQIVCPSFVAKTQLWVRVAKILFLSVSLPAIAQVSGGTSSLPGLTLRLAGGSDIYIDSPGSPIESFGDFLFKKTSINQILYPDFQPEWVGVSFRSAGYS